MKANRKIKYVFKLKSIQQTVLVLKNMALFSIFLGVLFSEISCTEQKPSQALSDKDFLDSISNENLRASDHKIDSLLKHGDFSDHRRAILYSEKGRLLANLEKDIEAIGSLKEALYLFRQENDKKFLAKTNILIGDSYALLSKQDSAVNYTNEAYNIYKEIGDKEGEAKALNSLSHLAMLRGDHDGSILKIKKAIQIQLELNDKESLTSSYNNLGYILEEVQDYDQAIKYYTEAIALNKEVDRMNTYALRNLGYVYLLKDDPKKCISIYKEALKIEEKAERYVIQKSIYHVLIEASLKDENYDDVPMYILKKDSVTQILAAIEDEERTEQINTTYEQFIEQENLKQRLELDKKNKYIFGAVLGLLLLLSLIVIQRNRNSRLEMKQQALELESKMLRTQMNPHFIFNTLTAIQKKVFDNDPLELMTYISKFAKLIRQNFDFVNQKEISLEEDLDALTNYIETQQFRFNDKFSYSIDIDDAIDPNEINIPPMLLQIFVENAIEHGLKPKVSDVPCELKIKISKEKTFINFEITDNGVGYSPQEKTKEHATDIFIKRLIIRNLGEEKYFKINSLGNNLGTKVSFKLNLSDD